MNNLKAFESRAALAIGYGQHKAKEIFARAESNDVRNLEDAAKLGAVRGEMKMKYLPNQYRGGAVIAGFGYSTERIAAGCVSAAKAGNPSEVQ